MAAADNSTVIPTAPAVVTARSTALAIGVGGAALAVVVGCLRQRAPTTGRAGRESSPMSRPEVVPVEPDRELARELAAAIPAGQVRAHFQPVVSPGNGDVVGMEALARWTHPRRGTVPPAEFVPLAERTGLIGELGLSVLADACRGAREVSDAWGRDLLLTVNVSGRELMAPDYPHRVLQTLRRTGWPADLLVVEVTESVVDGSSGQALAALDDLRAHGVSVAIDDFGTGYSAFSRLDTMPADYLKLDNVFTADITTSPRRAGVLQALLSLASALGLQVIAEGVETQEQADLLVGMGCTLAQGWLFGRPVPPAELAARVPVPVDLTQQLDPHSTPQFTPHPVPGSTPQQAPAVGQR